jgi:type IV secretory pathway TrbF-like protein
MLQHLGCSLIKSAASMSIYSTHVYQNLIEPAVIQVLAGLGMTPIAPAMTPPRPPTYLTVMLDGKLIGHVRSLSAPALVSRLRDIKAAKLAEEESTPVGATTIMLDVSHAWSQLT